MTITNKNIWGYDYLAECVLYAMEEYVNKCDHFTDDQKNQVAHWLLDSSVDVLLVEAIKNAIDGADQLKIEVE